MLPRAIYEILPFIYAPAGLIAVAGLDTTYGRICGALLLSAAVSIYTMRKLYRGEA